MTRAPRPSALVLACSAMLTLPIVSLVALWFLCLYMAARDPQQAASLSGPTWIVGVMFPVPATLFLLAEYRAIRRRDVRAAAWVAGLCLWLPVCGSIGWAEGLLCLTGVIARCRHWKSWAEFSIYSAVLAYAGIVGIGHLHWWRVLRASKKVEDVAWDA